MSANAREEILAAAKLVAQAHGYAGLNFRDLAQEVGIKAASIYYHFPSKADLAAAVAKRYWEDSAAYLESLLQNSRGRWKHCAATLKPFAGHWKTTIVSASAALCLRNSMIYPT